LHLNALPFNLAFVLLYFWVLFNLVHLSPLALIIAAAASVP
jgi:hypothetical protein